MQANGVAGCSNCGEGRCDWEQQYCVVMLCLSSHLSHVSTMGASRPHWSRFELCSCCGSCSQSVCCSTGAATFIFHIIFHIINIIFIAVSCCCCCCCCCHHAVHCIACNVHSTCMYFPAAHVKACVTLQWSQARHSQSFSSCTGWAF